MLRVNLDGVVNEAAATYLERAVEAAERGPCNVVLVVIDTPGGALEATRSIAKAFLGATVPVVSFVYPSGARAGSAGLFVSEAAHVAAMAPGTNIGAAHPVTITGQDPEQAGGKQLAQKIENDAAAFARAIGERRGRNVEWLEKAVTASAAITAQEAVDLRVIDLVASSVPDLLKKLDGRSVSVAGDEVRLETSGVSVVSFERTVRERVLSVLGHPNVAYALLMLGALGLMFEFYHPGLLVPAGVGLFSLLLAAIGLNMLPVHLGAIALLAVAVALFVAEMYLTSFGLLTAAGIVALLLGSSLLIDRTSPEFFAEPSVRVSWGLVVPLGLVMAGLAGMFAWQAARLRRVPPRTGSEGLIGERAEAATSIDNRQGWVRVHGERWRAQSSKVVAEGSTVRVVARRGLTLLVEPEPAADLPLRGAPER